MMALTLGTKLDRYEIRSKLGAGGRRPAPQGFGSAHRSAGIINEEQLSLTPG